MTQPPTSACVTSAIMICRPCKAVTLRSCNLSSTAHQPHSSSYNHVRTKLDQLSSNDLVLCNEFAWKRNQASHNVRHVATVSERLGCEQTSFANVCCSPGRSRPDMFRTEFSFRWPEKMLTRMIASNQLQYLLLFCIIYLHRTGCQKRDCISQRPPLSNDKA